MNNTHTEDCFIRPTDCDLLHRMRPDALFIAMQECGERHAIELGVGYDALIRRGMFFVLSRIHVNVLRAPQSGETLVHTTWPGTVNHFFFPRYHILAQKDGTPVVQAAALWVLLDADKRKIVTPSNSGIRFPDNSAIPAPTSLPMRLPAPLDAMSTSQRAPMYSDFDVNGHVNNTRYIAWLCDALGVDTMRSRYIGELTAGYEKEIRAQDPLALSLSRDGDAFFFNITSAQGDKHFVAGGTLLCT